MPYNNLISRGDVQALIPEDVSQEMLEGLTTESAAMTMFRSVPMGTNQTRMPVLAALPIAYFVAGDTGLKQTTEMAWANKYLNVEEIAAIIPIPESVLDDLGQPIWATVQPLCQEAIGRALDAAVFFGTNIPGTWPTAIVPAAVAAGNTRTIGTANAASGGLAEDINQLFALIEADGYNAQDVISTVGLRASTRAIRDTAGNRTMDVTATDWWGVPVAYPMPGLWPTAGATVRAIAGDFNRGILGVRSDFTWKLLDQAVITADDGTVIFNLPQQDMVAMRVVFRVAFQVSNPINYQQQVEASRYPFGVLMAA